MIPLVSWLLATAAGLAGFWLGAVWASREVEQDFRDSRRCFNPDHSYLSGSQGTPRRGPVPVEDLDGRLWRKGE